MFEATVVATVQTLLQRKFYKIKYPNLIKTTAVRKT